MTEITMEVVGRFMWLVEGTATLPGPAIMLAVVLGAATTADAAAAAPCD